jgi:hypothetical protein
LSNEWFGQTLANFDGCNCPKSRRIGTLIILEIPLKLEANLWSVEQFV